jgi:hypothetical protein
MQLAHVISDTHDAGACIDGLRDEQAPHPSHMADGQLPCKLLVEVLESIHGMNVRRRSD